MSLSAAAQTRCAWVTDDPLYIQYHDTEWGVPERDNHKLFEMICLEGQQAGLSRLVILKSVKITGSRSFSLIRKSGGHDRGRCGQTDAKPGIVRQRAKINAIISNAKAYRRCRRPVKISVIFVEFHQ